MDETELAALVRLAATAVTVAVRENGRQYVPALLASTATKQHGASFVTLQQDQRLRGCIGTLTACRALAEDVTCNARSAALDDPRFLPLSAIELSETSVGVAVLTTPQAIMFRDEDELCRQLRPGIDGLIVSHGQQRATYLPAVWEQLPAAPDFVAELRKKAGIRPVVPTSAVTFERYTTQHSPILKLLNADRKD
jgi:AmmeMemoRadiSam system protein A